MARLRYYFVFILYISLHQAVNAEENNLSSESLLTKYANLFKQRRYNDIVTNIRSLFKERSQSEAKDKKLDELISDATSALDSVKTKLEKLDKDDVLTLDPQPTAKENRYKRSIDNETIDEVNSASVENVTEAESDTTETTDKIETITDSIEVLNVKNDTSDQLLNVTNDVDDELTPTRRSWPIGEVVPPSKYETAPPIRYDITPLSRYDVTPPSRYEVTSKSRVADVTPHSTIDVAHHSANDVIPNPKIDVQSRIKDKLISYLEETFNDIERKISPLTHIKAALSNNNEYRIGYIIANIDTLAINLNKWKNNMVANQDSWSEETILDLFDKIKATNGVTTSLIESLKRQLPGSKELNRFT
ncbi:uncharacterized protein LOC111361813 [Spodoptera litura]|uniref:Uncharacterized protein LOC111361813 n=1 Tax=Spodoptera litura TaxID=69820 RepID=A0A9J7J1V6_SPOLT|nr:uncharacterized protein LOC111361813 [Spodoptera litura]